jgi:hypothetical protein
VPPSAHGVDLTPEMPLADRTRALLAAFDGETKDHGFNDGGDGTTYAEWFADLLDEWAAGESRVAKALSIVIGGVSDGDHHKMWVIDQMVRALTGCPTVTQSAKDWRGQPYSYEAQGESEEYLRFVRSVPGWEEGIPP